MKILNIVFIGLGIIIFGSYYLFLHTKLPFVIVAKIVRSENVDVQGVYGSIASGLKLDSFILKNKKGGEISLKKLVFDYELTENNEGTSLLKVHEISLDQLIIIETDKATNAEKIKKAKKHKKKQRSLSDLNEKIDVQIDKIIIKNIIIKNIHGDVFFRLDNFEINYVDFEKNGYSITDIFIKSSILDLTGSAKVISDETIIKLEGQVKQSQKNFLSKDLPFSALIKHKRDKYFYEFETFDNTLMVKKDFFNKVQVIFQNTKFNTYMNQDWPLKSMNAILNIDNKTKDYLLKDEAILSDGESSYIIDCETVKLSDDDLSIRFNTRDSLKSFIYDYNFDKQSYVEFK